METQLTWYGQSAFKIVTPSGKVLLVDPWLTNPVFEKAKDELAALKHVDLILVTHGHSDHVGDAVEIGMAVRNQDKIDMFERGEFVFRCCEDRIRQPRIDEQNFSARRNDLEGRLPVPS